MAFYLSPLVDVQEIDLSTTIPAVATSIGVIVLRNTYKGPEMKKTLVTTEEELISKFGKPTKHSYTDILAAAGYLKYGNKLYCTRVMPVSATFAGTNVDPLGTWTPATTATALKLVDLDSPDDPEYGDPDNFSNNEVLDGSAAQFIVHSRGAGGNKVRIATLDYATQQIFRNNKATSDALSAWYPYDSAGLIRGDWYDSATGNTAGGADLYDVREMTYPDFVQTDITLQNAQEFIIIVSAQEQGESDWQEVEQWRVTTKETAVDENGLPYFAETVINLTSQYIRINLNESTQYNANWDVPASNQYAHFAGGWDGDVGGVQTVTDSTIMIAMDLYDNPEEIDVTMFIDADKSENVKSYAIQLCETRKDCMTILDCPRSLVVDNRGNETTDLTDWRLGLDNFAFVYPNLNENTSYAAVYGNWLEVFDKWNNKYRWIPASGHVAGIYARTDNVRDPWWAPAGLNRAILTSVRRLAWNPNLGHRDMLYKNGINPIVSFAGQGKVIWGQKTMLDKPSSFNRVNVRRLFIVLEKAISTAAKYFLFEPNDEITRNQLRDMIIPFLRDVQARRGIYDFRVICDETNNTPERIDRNELWCTILIKATRAAEFIVLQFVSLKTGASFEEAAQQVNPLPK